MACLTTAVDIQPLTGVTSGGSVVITWSLDGTLPTFTIELANEKFHNSLAIANNVDPSEGNISVVIPPVPVGSGYTLQFVNITNIDQQYATSDQFSIAPTLSESSTATSSTATETVLSPSLSASVTATMPVSGSMGSTTAITARTSSSASSSAASHSPSSAAAPRFFQSASTEAACTGAVILGLLSALWIL
ncbi:hypothetical protein C8R45DRAFT_1095679 [Mycena sanguinolenta]|nr:hypothetical protein C8R45DRAFT_1095679 [Mycena sanguinolenta]